MIKTFDNKWTKDKVELVLQPPPDDFNYKSGIYYLQRNKNKLREEVVFIIYENTDF